MAWQSLSFDVIVSAAWQSLRKKMHLFLRDCAACSERSEESYSLLNDILINTYILIKLDRSSRKMDLVLFYFFIQCGVLDA